jgi:disulfide bond formation protein DsbB
MFFMVFALRAGVPVAVSPQIAALLVATGAALTLIGAWIFQYGFGYPPCPLCLEQRYAYYFAIPLAALLWLALGSFPGGQSVRRRTLIAGFAAIAIGMLWNAGLGAYHAGVEWHFWAGPSDCSGALAPLGGGGGLIEQLQSTRVVRCDEAPWRFLGLSLAGYNVLISLALAALALAGLRGVLVRPAGEDD